MVTAPATVRSVQSLVHVALIGVVWVAAVQTATSQAASSDRRVRPSDANIVDALARGVERSATLRGLVETIDATDGLVFIEDGRCSHSVRACLLITVTIAGPRRILRILVDLRKAPGCELTEAIGHELQHAVEVLGQRSIRSDLQVYNFFDMLGKAH